MKNVQLYNNITAHTLIIYDDNDDDDDDIGYLSE